MIAYARAVVLNQKSIPGRRTWTNMKELVATQRRCLGAFDPSHRCLERYQ